MGDMILRVNCLIGWVALVDGPMGSDNNNVLDWDDNNAE